MIFFSTFFRPVLLSATNKKPGAKEAAEKVAVL